MELSEEDVKRLSKKIGESIEVGCTTFDYAKTIELFADDKLKRRYRSLSEAKRDAVNFQKGNPIAYVKVVELKKKVHEFNVKEDRP